MIIIKDVFGGIVCDAKSIYITDRNQVRVIDSWRDYAPKTISNPITAFFDTQYEAERAIDWIFEQMKAQRGAVNIIIDMTECPAIKDNDEGASIEELRI